MTKEQFDKVYFGKAVHCDTEEKAKEFLELADSVGYKWVSGSSLIEGNLWEVYKEETYYRASNNSVMFGNINYPNLNTNQIIEYQLQPKFKVGARVKIKNTSYIINGQVGVIEKVYPLIPTLYAVKTDGDILLWWLRENELEKVEESIDDIIKEIKTKWNEINILLNQLEKRKV